MALKNKINLISLFLFLSTVICCESKINNVPTYLKYTEDTNLMLNIIKKFINEPDAKKINKVATAVQQTRIVSCTNYNDECDIYGKLISHLIEYTQDGNLSTEEQKKIEIQFAQLTSAIKEGKNKLKSLEK
jgi:hypothetical protein